MKRISIEKVVESAFQKWKSVMKYNLLFSLFYYGLTLLLSYGIFRYIGLWDKLMELAPLLTKNPEVYVSRMRALMESEQYASLSFLMLIASGMVFPLNVGMLHILDKKEKKEEISLNDLLVGYSGIEFFKYASYYMMWATIYNSFGNLGILGVALMLPWVLFTLMVVPVMFFEKEPLGTAVVASFQAIGRNIGLVFICLIVSAVISSLGALFIVGLLFTAPFSLAMIYTLYQQIFVENKELKN